MPVGFYNHIVPLVLNSHVQWSLTKSVYEYSYTA